MKSRSGSGIGSGMGGGKPSKDDGRAHRIRDRLMNECLDSIVGGDAGMARAMLRASGEVAPGADRDVAEMRRLLKPLTKVAAAPDLAFRILAETHRRRPFLPSFARHKISVWRVALAASFLGLITGGYLISESGGSGQGLGEGLGSEVALASVSPAVAIQSSVFESALVEPSIAVSLSPSLRRPLLALGEAGSLTPARRWGVSGGTGDSEVSVAGGERNAGGMASEDWGVGVGVGVGVGIGAIASRVGASSDGLELGGSSMLGRPTSLPTSSLLWSDGANTSLLKTNPLPACLIDSHIGERVGGRVGGPAFGRPVMRWVNPGFGTTFQGTFGIPAERGFGPSAGPGLPSLPRLDLDSLLAPK